MKNFKNQFIRQAIVNFLLLFSVVILSSGQTTKRIKTDDVLTAMRRASDYMANTVSCNGGYLWKYAEDFSVYEGEIPARASQIMVQDGTVDMGYLFLEAYEATGDQIYLEYAKKAANALIYGQHPMGGWHYFIDFDMHGIEEWYKQVASRFPSGAEEYRHYYGNCTFDDNTTQGATTYLLRIYMKTLLPEYLIPLKKALDFMLISQYPNGGWPQRYPLRYEFVHDGFPDYTAMYTLNDNAMSTTINVLLEAYTLLGDERYLEAAKKGGDFFIISQGPIGQAGWAEQFDMNLQPCWARTHEPPGYMPRQTLNTIFTLEQLFLYTGDRRYLRPITLALDWLKETGLQTLDSGLIEYARLYNPGNNLPIQCDTLDKRNEEGYQLYHYYPVDKKTYLATRTKFAGTTHAVLMQAQGNVVKYDIRSVTALFERIKNAPEKDRKNLYNELFRSKQKIQKTPDIKVIKEIINSINTNGAWIEDIEIFDYQPGHMIKGKKTIRGISVGSYLKNMKLLMAYL